MYIGLFFCIPYLEESGKFFVSPSPYALDAKPFRKVIAALKLWAVGKEMFFLEVTEVGSWKLEWNRHFLGKIPPLWDYFDEELQNFLCDVWSNCIKNSSVPTKIVVLHVAISTCLIMQLSGVIMIGSITLKCRFGEKLWSNGAWRHPSWKGVQLPLCFADIFQFG